MGNCAGREEDPPQRTFKVTNINDEHRLVHKGQMVVTLTELIYVDSKTKQQWQWPFKYLRRYGCEGNVFSFEAGRKCENGEGTYAFICDKANDLFTIVAKNIAQGNVLPDVDIGNGSVNENPFQRLHDDNGFHLPLPDLPPPEPDAPSSPPSLEPSTNPPPLKNYTNLVFTKDSIEPVPSQASDHAPYSKISFEETDKLSRQTKKVSLSDIRLNEGRRRHTTGGGGSTSSSGRKKRRGRESRSPSCSSTSSITLEVSTIPSVSDSIPEGPGDHNESSYQNLLIQDGEIVQATDPCHDQPTYSNIDIATGEIVPPLQPDYSNINIGHQSPPDIDEQSNYQNLLPGQGVVSSSTPLTTRRQPNFTPGVPPDQPNYSNITPGGDAIAEDSPNYSNLTLGDLPQRSHTFNHSEPRQYSNSRSTTLPAIRGGGGDTMQTYIELNLSSSQYIQLDIKAGGRGGGGEEEEETVETSHSLLSRDRVTSLTSMTRPSEDTSQHNDYTYLNFEAMAAVQSIREERDKKYEEKEKEKEEKEAKQNKKTGKSNKK